MICYFFAKPLRKAPTFCYVIMILLFCGKSQNIYANDNANKKWQATSKQPLPEFSALTSDLEDLLVNPVYQYHSFSLFSDPPPKTVQKRLLPFSMSTTKHIQVSSRRALSIPTPFQSLVDSPSNKAKILKAARGKRKLRNVQVKQSEVRLLPNSNSSCKVSVSHDGQWVAFARKNNRIISIHSLAHHGEAYTVDYSSSFGAPIQVLSRIEMAPDNKAMSIVFILNGRQYLAVIDFERATMQVPRSLRGLRVHSDSGRFSPNGKLITAHMPKTGDLQIIDWRNQKVIYRLHITHDQFYSANFENDNTILFSSSMVVYQVDLTSKQYSLFFLPLQYQGDSYDFEYAEASSGGKWVIACNDCDAFVYSRQTGQLKQTFTHGDTIQKVTSMDGKTIYIANSTKEGTVTGYSLDTGEPQLEYVSDSDNRDIKALKISPDGQTLVAGYRDGTIRLWDSKTGEISLQLKRRDGNDIADVWLTPDHKYLMSSAYSGGKIEVWRLHVNQNKLSAVISSLKSMMISCIGGEFEDNDEVFDNL